MTAKQTALLLTSTAVLTILAVPLAHAGAFALREQSAYGQGSSFAGVAAGGSLSSMFWNPATLMGIEAIEIEKVVSGVIPLSEIDVTSPVESDQGDIGKDAIVPAGYSAYRLNDRLVFGWASTAPSGWRRDTRRRFPLWRARDRRRLGSVFAQREPRPVIPGYRLSGGRRRGAGAIYRHSR
jgi:long-chain fatty acid transport protein